MADTKISGLTADTSPTSDDLIPTVNDPGGTPANKKVTLGNAITKAHGLSDSTVVGVASGVLTSGTDVAVADGGTGASDASGARTNLGLVIGTNVQAYDADLTTLSSAFTSPTTTDPASLAFAEGTDNGTNKITVTGVASVSSNKVLTLPDATDTLVGKATTDTLTNKTIDANGTGNSITNIEVADLASGVLDTDLSSVSGSDDTLPSAKATKAMGDLKLPLAGGTMSGNITLGENTSVALDPAGSADGKYSGITVTGVSGYSQAFGDVVTLDKDDSRWEAADISVAAAATGDARGVLGVVVSTGTDGNACTVLLNGIVRADANFPALTIGAPVYASTTGDIVVTQPTTTDHVIRIVGYALTADEIYFNPAGTWTTHT